MQKKVVQNSSDGNAVNLYKGKVKPKSGYVASCCWISDFIQVLLAVAAAQPDKYFYVDNWLCYPQNFSKQEVPRTRTETPDSAVPVAVGVTGYQASVSVIAGGRSRRREDEDRGGSGFEASNGSVR
eukprot:gene10598-2721_t